MNPTLFARCRAFFLLAAFFLALGGTPGGTAPLAAQERRSRIEVPETEFHFGTVNQGEKVTHEFFLKNVGNSDLVIQRVVSPCGCTAAVAANTLVKAGEKTAIRVTFDTTGFSGEKTKIVQVYTNDLDRPSINLTLSGAIDSDITIQPKSILFGEIARGTDEARTLKISVKQSAGLKITGVKSLSESVLIKETKGDDNDKEFAVWLAPEAPIGELRERLLINIGGSKPRALNVPVIANIQGSLTVEPKVVSFGVIGGRDLLKRSVRIKNMAQDSVELGEISTSDPAVTASLKAEENGKLFTVQVAVDPAKVQRDLRASVTIRTTNTEQPAVVLNVYGVLPPKG